jgi:hypothetical protein
LPSSRLIDIYIQIAPRPFRGISVYGPKAKLLWSRGKGFVNKKMTAGKP